MLPVVDMVTIIGVVFTMSVVGVAITMVGGWPSLCFQ